MGKESKMQKSDRVRFTLFIVLHVALCAAVLLCIIGLSALLSGDFMSITHDPTGLSDILSGIAFVFKVILVIGIYVVCVGVMLLLAAFFVLLLRFLAVTKDTLVTGYEVKATLAVMVAGAVLTLAAGMLFTGKDMFWVTGIPLLPILILEFTVYWIALLGRRQSKNLQNVSWENANQSAGGAPKEEKRISRAAGIVRFAVFCVIHIALCALVFCYARQAGELGTVDGVDYTNIDLSDLLSGTAELLGGLLYMAVMLVWSAVLLTPLRLIAIRKNTRITKLEINATLAVVIAGAVLTLTMGVIFMGVGALFVMGMIFLLVLVLEIAMYWMGLRFSPAGAA